jgi:hypothetical protein
VGSRALYCTKSILTKLTEEICALHFVHGLTPVVVQFLSHGIGGHPHHSSGDEAIHDPEYIDAVDVSFDRLDSAIPFHSKFAPPFGSWGRVIGSFTNLRKLSRIRFTFREYFDLELFIGYYPRWYDLMQLSNRVRIELRYCRDIRGQVPSPESLVIGQFIQLAEFERHPHWQESLRTGVPVQLGEMSWTDYVEPLYDTLSHMAPSESATPPDDYDHKEEF